MENFKLKNFTKGWVVGDFSPSIIKTTNFEVAVKHYASGDTEAKHYHKIATEISIINSGKFSFNGTLFIEGDIIVMKPNDWSDFKCVEEGSTTVIKTPSVPNDKYIN